MRKQPKSVGVVCAAMLAAALATLAFAGSAAATLTGEFAKFKFCPYTSAETDRCLYSATTSGEVKLGKKEVPIEKEVVLQGGYTVPDGATFSKFLAATNGITLSKAAQNVPGGLAGVVPESPTSPLVKALVKFFFENKITGLTSTLELAKPASEIRISESHLAEQLGIALKMPVKVHLENSFLGKSCYVGSSTSPIAWELTTGATKPPKPSEPIKGDVGDTSFPERGEILRLTDSELVDNTWAAPNATGCGGLLASVINPLVNSQLGITAAGSNTARLINTVDEVLAEAVKENDESGG